tara:strand:- start:618 stop:4199 length:3582 start_codon:yes stop_codon:yes gene_type:complete
MDIEQKKQDIQADIARQPANVVFARIDICNELQLADLLKISLTPFFTQTARSAAGSSNGDTTDSLHQVCINLAKQRALLQGENVNRPIYFDIGAITDYTHATNLTFPKLEDSSYSNKTSIPYIVMHDLNEDGGIVTLSSVSNANTDITNDEGEDVKYFTDFSKYFLTRSRANGELISIDENNAPYTTPTAAEPFFPANTINGETYSGTATDPTANSDVRHDFFLTANTTAVGFAGANNDITENKYEGNTFVTIELSNVSGTFAVSETITDFEGDTSTVKSSSNTTTVILETSDSKGTFVVGETITDLSTNATIGTVETVSNTETNITVTGSTFLTGSNTDISLGFDISETLTLDENTVSRNGTTVSVTANNHGVTPGEYIVLKGADDAFGEFNDTFIVEDVSQNTLSFSTTNSVSVTPTGDFSLVKNIVFGRTSNASAAIHTKTTNSSATIVFQSDDLDVGFSVGNTITGSTTSSTGVIDKRTKGGSWYQVKTNEVKTYYIASDSGTWDYDASNNPQGIESTANTGEFWLKNFEMVKINQIVAGTNSGASNETAKKMVLDIALATSSDKSGGYDSTVDTRLPGTYFAYPLKTYADQVHGGVTTLEAFSNFANVVIAPEGLEIDYTWKPLANNSGVATNTTHINQDGTVTTSTYNPENVTTLNKANFIAHLGPFDGTKSNDVYTSISSVKSSAVKTNSGTNFGVNNTPNYNNANANPFYPAVGGTHKNYSNTDNGITGTQPASLTANDIYAGSYTEIQTGATAPSGDNRYIIQNDLKWVYASNPLSSNVAALQVGTYAATFTDDYDDEVGAIVSETVVPSAIRNSTTTLLSKSQVPNTTLDATTSEYAVNSGVYQVRTNTGTGSGYTSGSYSDVSNIFNRVQYLINANKATTIGGTSGSYTVNDMETNFGKVYQLCKDLENADYGKGFEDPICNANGEHPNGGTYVTGQSDSSFETETNNLKTSMDNLITAHKSQFTNITTHDFTSGGTDYNIASNDGTYAGKVSTFKTEISNYRTTIKRRITEISNRIGYLNSKDVASGGSNREVLSLTISNAGTNYTAGTLTASGGGGSGFAGTYTVSGGNINSVTITNSGTGYTSAPTINIVEGSGTSGTSGSVTATVDSVAKLVSGTNQGFQGYTFNGGSGYANTIYNHANFIAGKKIRLLEKIQTAIDDVQALYDQIKSKRAQYYEYNQ